VWNLLYLSFSAFSLSLLGFPSFSRIPAAMKSRRLKEEESQSCVSIAEKARVAGSFWLYTLCTHVLYFYGFVYHAWSLLMNVKHFAWSIYHRNMSLDKTAYV
jgi:hypothetical protein